MRIATSAAKKEACYICPQNFSAATVRFVVRFARAVRSRNNGLMRELRADAEKLDRVCSKSGKADQSVWRRCLNTVEVGASQNA